MTTETDNTTWGDEPPRAAAPGPGWNGRKTLVAVAVAVGIAAAGGGVIYAAGNSEAAQQGMGGPRGAYGMRGGPGFTTTGGPFGDAQHGEFQTGEVTGVSDSSITVTSADGFTKTYRVDDDTRVNGGQGDLADIAAGDEVTLVAADSTVDTITEGDVVRGGDGRQGRSGQDRSGQDRPEQDRPEQDRPPVDGQDPPPPR
ncbi:hypothetical protein K7G98_30025 [Saccharothrix sp. MB29]|nr:hypothetical protein [Saccharothrix sp. MB29]